MIIDTHANRRVNKRFAIIGILFCFFILSTAKAEAIDNNKTVTFPTEITGDTAAAFNGGTCPAPYKAVNNIDIVNAFLGDDKETLFVAIPSGRFITFTFPDEIKKLKEGTLTIETTGADKATGEVSALLNDNTEQLLGSICETQATQKTTFSLDQDCLSNLKAIKITGTNKAGDYPGVDVVSVYIESDSTIRRYAIGKDTWKFVNLGYGKLEYWDYTKMYPLAYSKLLYEMHNSFNDGMCFGYSILIPSVIENLTPFTTGGYDIHDYEFEDVKKDLMYGQMYQWSVPVCAAMRFNQGELNKLCEAVRNEMYRQGDPVVISVWGGSHAVLASSIIKDTPEEVIIGVYDSNFPDNIYIYKDDPSLYNKPIYISVRLYGKDGKYNRCEWGLSTEEGGEWVKNMGDITQSVNFFKDINLFSDKIYWADYGSFAMLRKPSGTLDPKVEAYDINTMEGEDTNNTDDCLYWAKVTDGEYSITDVKANDEIQVALENKIISITPNTDSDISIKSSDEMEYAEVNISSNTTISAKCEYLETQPDDSVVQTELSLQGKDAVSLKINNKDVISNGVTDLSIEQIDGKFDNDAGLIGKTVYRDTYGQIDAGVEHVVNIDSGTDNPDDSTPVNPTPINPQPAPIVAPSPAAPAEIVDLPTVKISKPKAAKKSATIKWKKVNKKNLKMIQGVEIQVATDSGFTNIVKTAVAGKKKTSKKIKGLTSKQTYYVRIRAYKNAADGKHVSTWKVKKIKIK